MSSKKAILMSQHEHDRGERIERSGMVTKTIKRRRNGDFIRFAAWHGETVSNMCKSPHWRSRCKIGGSSHGPQAHRFVGVASMLTYWCGSAMGLWVEINQTNGRKNFDAWSIMGGWIHGVTVQMIYPSQLHLGELGSTWGAVYPSCLQETEEGVGDEHPLRESLSGSRWGVVVCI